MTDAWVVVRTGGSGPRKTYGPFFGPDGRAMAERLAKRVSEIHMSAIVRVERVGA